MNNHGWVDNLAWLYKVRSANNNRQTNFTFFPTYDECYTANFFRLMSIKHIKIIPYINFINTAISEEKSYLSIKISSCH